MKTLQLPIIKKWLDMIMSGEKTEEYREIKPFWVSRLVKNLNFDEMQMASPNVIWKDITQVQLINGYGSTKPNAVIEVLSIEVGKPNPAWCDGWEGEDVFIFKLGKVIKSENI